MCGSCTFAIEAALIASNQAPNLNHDFSFLHWPAFKIKEFKKVYEKTTAMKSSEITFNIQASDLNSSAVEFCKNNATRAGSNQSIIIRQMDIHQLELPEHVEQGLLILNPPYGQRISEKNITMSLWRDIGTMIKRNYASHPQWKTIVVCPDVEHERALHAKVKRRLILNHGGSAVSVLEI